MSTYKLKALDRFHVCGDAPSLDHVAFNSCWLYCNKIGVAGIVDLKWELFVLHVRCIGDFFQYVDKDDFSNERYVSKGRPINVEVHLVLFPFYEVWLDGAYLL